MNKKYTITEIKDLWKTYESSVGWSVKIKGKRKVYLDAPTPDETAGAISVTCQGVNKLMDFPEYIEAKRG